MALLQQGLAAVVEALRVGGALQLDAVRLGDGVGGELRDLAHDGLAALLLGDERGPQGHLLHLQEQVRGAAAGGRQPQRVGRLELDHEPVVLVVGRAPARVALVVQALVVRRVAVRLARQRRIPDCRIDAGSGHAVAEVAGRGRARADAGQPLLARLQRALHRSAELAGGLLLLALAEQRHADVLARLHEPRARAQGAPAGGDGERVLARAEVGRGAVGLQDPDRGQPELPELALRQLASLRQQRQRLVRLAGVDQQRRRVDQRQRVARAAHGGDQQRGQGALVRLPQESRGRQPLGAERGLEEGAGAQLAPARPVQARRPSAPTRAPRRTSAGAGRWAPAGPAAA